MSNTLRHAAVAGLAAALLSTSSAAQLLPGVSIPQVSVQVPPPNLPGVGPVLVDGPIPQPVRQAVRPTLDKRCMACHDGSNPHLPNLSNYDGLKKVAEKDTGTPLLTLVRVSHIHLFGLTFIFFLVGLIFSHAYLRPVWLKCAIVMLPFLSIAIDIFSWYITKYYHPFAWVVMGSGAVTGLCFGFMWVMSVWQMWIGRPPAAIAAQEPEPAVENVG